MGRALLEVERLGKSFRGVTAVHDLSFTVEPGQVYAVIGPNGAGKTTLFNLVTGFERPASGAIRIGGRTVTGLPAHRLARLGVARTFQNLQVCMNLSAVENVMLGAHLGQDRSLWRGLLRWPALQRADRALRAAAAEGMRAVGLADYIGAPAAALPYGALKRLEIARALAAFAPVPGGTGASAPRAGLLFLDEPAAGLHPGERDGIAALIRSLAERGITVVLVEHDMKMVMNLADRILVLCEGRRLAEGSAEEIRHHPGVVTAYLGRAAFAPGPGGTGDTAARAGGWEDVDEARAGE